MYFVGYRPCDLSGPKLSGFVSVTSSDLPMKPQILLHAFAPMAHDAIREELSFWSEGLFAMELDTN